MENQRFVLASVANPIFAREWQVRWRQARSYWLLLALVALLSLLTGWVYSSTIHRLGSPRLFPTWGMSPPIWGAPLSASSSSFLEQAPRVGRALFQALALGDCFACLFLGAALAAPGIARERELGLLESLQLSRMRPTSQILARYLSAVAFLIVLQVATLPTYCIILTLGGVSLPEIGAVALVIGLTVLLSAALGIWFSARSYRPSSALFGVLGALAVWSLWSLWQASAWLPWGGASKFFFSALHPAVLIQSLTNPQSIVSYTTFGALPMVVAFAQQTQLALQVTSLFDLVLIFTLLWSATRRVNAPLPPAAWQGRNRWIERRKASLAARQEEAKIRHEQQHLGDHVQGALVADLPFDRLVHFRNPLLSREVKSRFRLRKASLPIFLLRFAAFIAGASIWLTVVFSLLDSSAASRGDVVGTIVFTLWGLGVPSVCALAAASFAREKESGTWEGLRLSLLNPTEIVRSKWLSVLISFAYYSAPLWVLLPFAFVRDGMAPSAFLGALVGAASVGAFCAFGLWVSWRSPNPTAALGWTLGVAFALLFAVPQIEQLTGLEQQFARLFFGNSSYYGSAWGIPSSSYSYNYAYGHSNYFAARSWWLWLHVWQPTQVLSLMGLSLRPTGLAPRTTPYYGSSYYGNVDQSIDYVLVFVHLVLAVGVCLFFLHQVRREMERQYE